MGKPGVMFYFEMLPCLAELTEKEQAELFRLILTYGQCGKVPRMSSKLRLLWPLLQPRLDRDTDRYDRTVLRNAYARYAKEAIKNNAQKMTFDQWKETVDTSELTETPSESPWEPSESPWELSESPWELSESPWESSLAQTTIHNQQSTNNKLQSTIHSPQAVTVEPSATPVSFSPPGREEILAYCQENGFLMDVDSFLDYYTANGWKVGKSPMKNWQAAVRRWCRKEEADGKTADSHSWNIGITL